ncbi:hypothetical protein RJ641_029540 [Dillenia turbinata]|uniref:Uncharacterized protein n=1 Tax=Dillenia turbinata TaxID=194707 RepID=A0AAN8VYG7_9MAGN
MEAKMENKRERPRSFDETLMIVVGRPERALGLTRKFSIIPSLDIEQETGKMKILERTNYEVPQKMLMRNSKSLSPRFLVNIDELTNNADQNPSEEDSTLLDPSKYEHEEDHEQSIWRNMQIQPTLPISLKAININ